MGADAFAGGTRRLPPKRRVVVAVSRANAMGLDLRRRVDSNSRDRRRDDDISFLDLVSSSKSSSFEEKRWLLTADDG